MQVARSSHAMVLLANGTVLVAGGSTGDDGPHRHIAAAEVFDPKTGQWTAVGPLREARWGPTASLLPSGKVLFAGGSFGQIGSRDSAEIYDPLRRRFEDAGKLDQHRNGHRAIRLADGRFLLVGGHSLGRYLASCEIYVP